MSILNEFGFRKDARRSSQIRNIIYQTQVCRQADGSAFLQQGETKVIAAVYGPHECQFRSRLSDECCIINCQYSQATYSTADRRNRPRGDRRGGNYSRLLERAFESVIITSIFPRSQIDIFCEVIEADGGELPACVNAASLALADAGIPIFGLAAATECGSVDGVPCADMSSSEHSELVPRLTVATIGGKENIIMIEMKNLVHRNHLQGLLQTGIDTCAKIHACLETAAFENVKAAHNLE